MARCATCTRDAVLRITGRIPRRTLYSASSCDRCAASHRRQAERAGPVIEEPFDTAQDRLF